MHFHYALPTPEHSCFVQAVAAQDEAAAGRLSVREQEIRFGGPQQVQLSLAPASGNDGALVSLSISPKAAPPALVSKPLARNSPCLTPDCTGKISSVQVKSGRGAQMKILKVLVQFRETNLRRDRAREREKAKARHAADAARQAQEAEERDKLLAERMAARQAQLQAEEAAAAQERERQANEERERAAERNKAKQEREAAAAAAAAAKAALAAKTASPVKAAAPTPAAPSVPATPVQPAVRSQVRPGAPVFHPATSASSDSPVQGARPVAVTTAQPPAEVAVTASSPLLPGNWAASVAPAVPTPSPALLSGNWAALIGGGSAAASSPTAAAPSTPSAASAAAAAAAAAVAAAAKSGLSRKERKDRKGRGATLPGALPVGVPLVTPGAFANVPVSSHVLNGLVRCRAGHPSRYLYVQHFSSIGDLQSQCAPFGLQSVTQCFQPTALLLEFGSVDQSAACFELLNNMYFARFAEEPLMLLMDGESEAMPVTLPAVQAALLPLLPYGGMYAAQQQQMLQQQQQQQQQQLQLQISKREKAKWKRQEAILQSKERQQRKQDKLGGAGSRGAGELLREGSGDSPFRTPSDGGDSPNLSTSLPLHDDEAFPTLEAAANRVEQSRETALSSRGASADDDEPSSALQPDSPLHAFLPTPLFDSPARISGRTQRHAGGVGTLAGDAAGRSTPADDELASLPSSSAGLELANGSTLPGARTRTPSSARDLFSIFARTPSASKTADTVINGEAAAAAPSPALFSTPAMSSTWGPFDPTATPAASTASTAARRGGAQTGEADWGWNGTAPDGTPAMPAQTAAGDAEWPTSGGGSGALSWLHVPNGSAGASSSSGAFSSLFSPAPALVSSVDSPELSPEAASLSMRMLDDPADEFVDADVGAGWEVGEDGDAGAEQPGSSALGTLEQADSLALLNNSQLLSPAANSGGGQWGQSVESTWSISDPTAQLTGFSAAGGSIYSLLSGASASPAEGTGEESLLHDSSSIRSFLQRSFGAGISASGLPQLEGGATTSAGAAGFASASPFAPPAAGSPSPDPFGASGAGGARSAPPPSTVNINLNLNVQLNITNVHISHPPSAAAAAASSRPSRVAATPPPPTAAVAGGGNATPSSESPGQEVPAGGGGGQTSSGDPLVHQTHTAWQSSAHATTTFAQLAAARGRAAHGGDEEGRQSPLDGSWEVVGKTAKARMSRQSSASGAR